MKLNSLFENTHIPILQQKQHQWPCHGLPHHTLRTPHSALRHPPSAVRSPWCIRPCNRLHSTMQLNNQPTNQPIKPNLNHPTNQPTLRRSCLPLLQQEGENDGAEELGIANLGGVYFVLFVGSIFASIYGFVEWICHVYGTARRNKVPVWPGRAYLCNK